MQSVNHYHSIFQIQHLPSIGLPSGDILQHLLSDPAVLGEVVGDLVVWLDESVVHHIQPLVHHANLQKR